MREIFGGTLCYLGILPFYRKFVSGPTTSSFRALVYHQVVGDVDADTAKEIPGVISESEFKIQVEHLIKHFKLISLGEVLDFLESGKIPDNSILLTFDDGYRNIYKYAFPILKHYRAPALIFCTGNTLEGGALWCDELFEAVLKTRLSSTVIDGEMFRFRNMKDRLRVYESLILDLQGENSYQRREKLGKIINGLKVNLEEKSSTYLKEDEIREMQEFGLEFGSHTMNHPLLGAIKDTKELEWEIAESIRVLEGITGRKCLSFAYPFGSENSYTDDCMRVLKDAGIRVAFTTKRGGNKRTCNPYLFHRFIVRSDSKYFFRWQLSGLLDG